MHNYILDLVVQLRTFMTGSVISSSCLLLGKLDGKFSTMFLLISNDTKDHWTSSSLMFSLTK